MKKISKIHFNRLFKMLIIVFFINIKLSSTVLGSSSLGSPERSLLSLLCLIASKTDKQDIDNNNPHLAAKTTILPFTYYKEEESYLHKSHEPFNWPNTFVIEADKVELHISGQELNPTANSTLSYPLTLFKDETGTFENITWVNQGDGATYVDLPTTQDFLLEIKNDQEVCINLQNHLHEKENSWIPERYETNWKVAENINKQAHKHQDIEYQAKQLQDLSDKTSYQINKHNSVFLTINFKKVNGFSEEEDEESKEVLNIISEGARALQNNNMNAPDQSICLMPLSAQYDNPVEILLLPSEETNKAHQSEQSASCENIQHNKTLPCHQERQNRKKPANISTTRRQQNPGIFCCLFTCAFRIKASEVRLSETNSTDYLQLSAPQKKPSLGPLFDCETSNATQSEPKQPQAPTVKILKTPEPIAQDVISHQQKQEVTSPQTHPKSLVNKCPLNLAENRFLKSDEKQLSGTLYLKRTHIPKKNSFKDASNKVIENIRKEFSLSHLASLSEQFLLGFDKVSGFENQGIPPSYLQ